MLNYSGQINYNSQFNEQGSIFNRNKDKNDYQLTVDNQSVYNIPSNNPEIQLEDVQKKLNLKKSIGIGLGLGSTALLGLGILLFLSKGNFKTKVDILNKEAKKINLDSANKKFLSFWTKIKNKVTEKTTNVLTKMSDWVSPWMNNPVAIRDIGIEEVSDKLYLSKVTNWLKGFYQKLSIGTIDSMYSKSGTKFSQAYLELEKAIENLASSKKIDSAKKEKLLQSLKGINSAFEDGFSQINRNKRFKNAKEKLECAKKIVRDYIFNYKKGDGIKGYFKNHSMLFGKDKKYISFNLPEILQKKNELSGAVLKKYSTIDEGLKNQLNELAQIMGKDSKEYKKLAKKVLNANNSLSKTVNTESQLLYEKFIELSVGSATSDTLFFLIPAAGFGYNLCKSKDKEERISKTLTVGVPLIAGLGVSFVSAAKMDNAIKSLFVGTVSGWILNFFGRKIDDFRKKLKQQKEFNQQAREFYIKNSKTIQTA